MPSEIQSMEICILNLKFINIRNMKNQRRLIIFCAIISCTFTACQKSLQQIIAETEPATCTIYTYDEYGSPSGSGSGFFIESNGVGVTNWHVLDKSIKAIVKMPNGNQYEIDSVLSASQKKDLLVFKIKNPDNIIFPTLAFCTEKPTKGEAVYNISAPLGLESSISEGIIASYRENAQGELVQVTSPLSPGSSGSPLLDTKGKVFAVTSFKRKGGENVSFGVIVDKDFRNQLDKKEFYKKNRKFNSDKSDYVLLNLMPDRGANIMLNAIEFGSTATTLYLTYTNMLLSSATNGWYLWCELNKKDNGFFIEDKDTKQRYYVTSSTLEVNKEKSTPIGLAEVVQFKVHFPVIKNKLSNIDIRWGEDGREAQFTNINLDDYRESLSIDEFHYNRTYALQCTTEGGDFVTTISMLTELLDENPADVISLNMMAILSYLLDNNTDARYYLDEAIDQNPNDELAYLNRATMSEHSKDIESAISDISQAINLVPQQPDYYLTRATYYFQKEDYKHALEDLDKCLEISDKEDGFIDDPYFYELRAYVNYYLKNIKAARKDCQKAYKLSIDPEADKRIQALYDLL